MCPLPKCKKTEFLQNSDWIWVYKKCTQFWGNMFVTHTIINVKYSGNQRDMKYFCDSNIFGFISNYFWDLHYWTYCMIQLRYNTLKIHFKQKVKIKKELIWSPKLTTIMCDSDKLSWALSISPLNDVIIWVIWRWHVKSTQSLHTRFFGNWKDFDKKLQNFWF